MKRSSEASDITGRIKRVREAISAVETQLRTTVLKGRRWENLDQQEQIQVNAHSLKKVKITTSDDDMAANSGSINHEIFRKRK